MPCFSGKTHTMPALHHTLLYKWVQVISNRINLSLEKHMKMKDEVGNSISLTPAPCTFLLWKVNHPHHFMTKRRGPSVDMQAPLCEKLRSLVSTPGTTVNNDPFYFTSRREGKAGDQQANREEGEQTVYLGSKQTVPRMPQALAVQKRHQRSCSSRRWKPQH